MHCCANPTQFASWRGPQRRLRCKITGEEEGVCAHRQEEQVQPVWGWFPHPSDLELHLRSRESAMAGGTGRCNVLYAVAFQQGCVTSLLLWLRLFPSSCHGVSRSKATGQSFIPKLWIVAAVPQHT